MKNFLKENSAQGKSRQFIILLFVILFIINIVSTIFYFLYISDNSFNPGHSILLSLITSLPVLLLFFYKDRNNKTENECINYKIISETVREAIILIDQNQKIIYANPSVVNVLGFSREELIDKNILDFIPEYTDLPEKIFDYENALAYYGNHKDGHDLPIEVSSACFYEQGMSKTILLIRDIRDHLELKRKLRADLQFSQTLIDNIPNPIYYKNLDGVFLGFNSSFLNFFNLKKTDIINKKAEDVFPEEISKKFKWLDELSSKSTCHLNNETELVDSNGVLKDVIIYQAPYPKMNEREAGFVGSITDITAIKKSKRALMESEARLKAIYRSSAIAIARVSLERKILECNPVFVSFLKYTEEELKVIPVRDYTHPDDVENDQFLFHELLNGNKSTYALEKRYITVDGKIVWGRLNMSVVKDQNKNPLFCIAMVEDITERRLAEEALEASEEKWKSLVENAPDFILTLDLELKVNFINVKLPDELKKGIVGQSIINFLRPNDKEGLKKAINEVIKEGSPNSYFVQGYHLNGNEAWYSTRIGPIFYEGKVSGVILIISDISDQKKVEEALTNTERKLKEISFNFPGIIFQFSINPDNEINFKYLSDSTQEFLGMSSESILADPGNFFNLIPEQERNSVKNSIIETKQNHWTLDFRLNTENKNRIWVRSTASKQMDIKEKDSIWNGVLLDITKQVKAEEELHLAATIYENTIEAVMITDCNGIIQSVNNAFTQITGYSSDEAVGRVANLLKEDYEDQEFSINMWSALNTKGTWTGETENIRKNREKYPLWLSITEVKNSDDKVIHYVAIFSDITERKKHEDYIHYHAYHDSLTDLPNRKMFHEILVKSLAQNERSNHFLAILFIDLDGFKAINDNYGHNIGDLLLIEVGNRLKSSVRKGDTIARLGGDEFTLILPQLKTEKDSEIIAKKILSAFLKPFIIDNNILNVGTSIGISLHPNDGNDAEELIRKADDSMYYIKKDGKNSYKKYSEEVELVKAKWEQY